MSNCFGKENEKGKTNSNEIEETIRRVDRIRQLVELIVASASSPSLRINQ